MSILTVAIPTYDRNEVLRRNLELLVPQLTPDCQLLILDNFSPRPVEPGIKDLLDKAPLGVVCHVMRHRVNVGAAANLLRCFECCDTEWLWILGDDDLVAEDAIATILDAIGRQSQATFIHFAHPREDLRRNDCRIDGLQGFVETIDDFGSTLCISAGIYRISPLLKHLRFGYFYAMTPHLGVLLRTLLDGGWVWLSQKPIIQGSPATANGWSRFKYALSIMDLLILPMTHNTRQLLAMKILARPSAIRTLPALAFYASQTGDKRMALWLYDQISYRFFRSAPRRRGRWLCKCCRWLVTFPSLGTKLIVFYARVRFGQEKAALMLSEFDHCTDLFSRI